MNSLEDKISNTAATIQPNPFWFWEKLFDKSFKSNQNLKFSCLYLFPFSHKVVPRKASGGGGVIGRRGGGGGVVYHTSTGQYIGVTTIFFLEGQKFLVVCLFWGGCHHPNQVITVKHEKSFIRI